MVPGPPDRHSRPEDPNLPHSRRNDMAQRLMTPLCFASILAAALIAEGAIAAHVPAGTERTASPADEPATYADIYRLGSSEG